MKLNDRQWLEKHFKFCESCDAWMPKHLYECCICHHFQSDFKDAAILTPMLDTLCSMRICNETERRAIDKDST